MYCKNCGKFIGTDADVCEECKQKEEAFKEEVKGETEYQPVDPFANTSSYKPPVFQQDTSMINLGKAIAAIILSYVGFSFVYAGIMVIWEPVATIVCTLLGLAPTIIGFVFGIQSISNFKMTKYIRSGKRIPVLILGISSVVLSGLSMFLAFIILIIAGAM